MTKLLEYKDKNAKNISVGDILFYSEENYGCACEGDSILEVVDINDDSISTITRIFIPPFQHHDNPKYEEINSQTENVEPFFECPRSIFDSKCYEIIGNITTDKHMITVDFAEKNFPIHVKMKEQNFFAKLSNSSEVMTDTKIRDSKGNIYNSCHFIDKIIQFLDTQIENANAIKIELENVRAINSELRKESSEGDYKDKLKIVEDYLGVNFEGRYGQYFVSGVRDIAHKIKELEKENQELKEEINNLTNKN